MNFIEYLYEEHPLLLAAVICVILVSWCFLAITFPRITIGGTLAFVFYKLFLAYKKYRKENP